MYTSIVTKADVSTKANDDTFEEVTWIGGRIPGKNVRQVGKY